MDEENETHDGVIWFWTLVLVIVIMLFVGWILLLVIQGTLGARGSPTGPPGVLGGMGLTGSKGVVGSQGHAGTPSSRIGPTGSDGIQGPRGITGQTGPGSDITGPPSNVTGPQGLTPTGAMQLGVIFTNSGGPQPPTGDFPPTGSTYNRIWDDYEEYRIGCQVNCMNSVSTIIPCTLSFVRIGANVTMGIVPYANQILFLATGNDSTASALIRLNSNTLNQLLRFFLTVPPHPVLNPFGSWYAGFHIQVLSFGIGRRIPGLLLINAINQVVTISISACVLTGQTGNTGGTVPNDIIQYGGFNPLNGYFGMIDALYASWNLLPGSI